jgi:hypothetical protein
VRSRPPERNFGVNQRGATVPTRRRHRFDALRCRVAADLRRRGFGIAILFGEDQDLDLILIRGGHLQRVQMKYAKPSLSGQLAGTRSAEDCADLEVEPAGIEPATS